MAKEKIDPEISDICENIRRYMASNKGKVAFVCSFVAFNAEGKCDNCGDHTHDMPDDSKSRIMAYGDLGLLRVLTNELRDAIEEEKDKDGFVMI